MTSLDPDKEAEEALREGRELAKCGELPRAIACFTRAIELAPDSDEAWQNRARARLEQGDHAGAVEDLTRAIELQDEVDDMLHYQRALGRMWLGDADGALVDFDRAIELDPQHAMAFSARGHLLYDLGRWVEARDSLALAVGIQPKRFPYSRLWLWLARARTGQGEVANAELRASISKGGDAWWAWLAGHLLGDVSEEELVEGAQGAEQECEASFFAGSKRLVAGDVDGARRHLEKCLSGPKDVNEYRTAVAELARLRAQAQSSESSSP